MKNGFGFLLLISVHSTQTWGGDLYSPEDKLTLLDINSFKETVLGSSTAWLVEFYSSWCGHCQHFAPTYKQLGAEVYGWKNIIRVAAIDCANDINTPICREYDIMGYPSLRLFPPKASPDFKGKDCKRGSLSIESIKGEMLNYLRDVETNQTHYLDIWPNIKPFSGTRLEDLWMDSTKFYILLLVEEQGSSIASEVILDLDSSIRKLNIPLQLRRAIKSPTSGPWVNELSGPNILVLDKEMSFKHELSVSEVNKESWSAAIKDYIWSKSKEFALTDKVEDGAKPSPLDSSQNLEKKEKTTNTKKELINRRYKVFLSDLEKAMFYSLSHEVAQHSAVAGEALVALQKYITVLDKYFPARPQIGIFLKKLHAWIHQHEDAVRGEDLADWITLYSSHHKIQPNQQWIGCKGSKASYGGYPCGLWSLWHTLTVAQEKSESGEPQEVLRAMQGFIQQFFGCQDCARHFDQTIRKGVGIDENVKTRKDAVLYLWNIHNRVNTRLAGDISEDPVYPKLVFPVKQFCTSCYSNVRGSNLWDEFELDEVFNFLKNQYSATKLSKQGIIESQVAEPVVPEPQVQDTNENLDLDNYRKKTQVNFIFFNGLDISFCALLWISSVVLIILLYLKFVLKKRFSHSAVIGLLRRKTTYNPLVGKV
ncbi:sulfhydryl oxidase 1 [Eurytemora carolleeae]|uniref:sulfhydryl oxidase 1 n=1 Tax=Eurytemora carolleeae TaxID=1294199 RepID=UPI000C792096|nr:sulfhydryl oxidase 1 [Eurytemora carolleeae]XP_023341747.1 sulfhydryl oxidase 1 [Eurytemora carolleeae]|eukprot:XP_023341746.1 sulfhydryl oxidase 1-like [Eurytemora affinis]